jgi:hypothetical protein
MSDDRTPGPIATATGSLLDWLSGVGVPAQVALPGTDIPAGSACVWPMALLPEQATRDTGGHGVLRLRVRYLVMGGSAAEPADPFDRILAADRTQSTVHIVIEPVGVDVWRGFGLAPRLGLYADVQAQVAPIRPAPPRVRAPLRLEGRPLGRVHGTVIGPGGAPLPGIRVVVEETGAATYTGNRGQFAFPAFPAGRPVRLQLSGRGVHLAAEVAGQSDEPIVIHCDMEGV